METPAAAANYVASRELVTPRRLREFFAPKSIVMVGASDNSGWGRLPSSPAARRRDSAGR